MVSVGKTLSYAIPIVERLQSLLPKVQRADGSYCIVIVPTREVDVSIILKRLRAGTKYNCSQSKHMSPEPCIVSRSEAHNVYL